jgi:hypothetical protein
VPTGETDDYLLIGLGPVNDLGDAPGVGQAVNVNNFEIGANKAPVPATSDFLDGGNGGGPDLDGNVPDLPSNAAPVASGVIGGGNIAITSADGVFNLQDVGVYGDLGIHCTQSASDCDVGTQNSFFNDPNLFPNTWDGSNGQQVNPNDADQTTRIDDPNYAGVTGNVDFTALMNDLFDDPASAANVIPALAATDILDLTDGSVQGEIKGDDAGVLNQIASDNSFTTANVAEQTLTIHLDPGLNVIDVVTLVGGSDKDFKLTNANLVIDGPADGFAVFRVADNANFLISNGNILTGTGGIGLNNVLFATSVISQTIDSFQNTILNGVAFWSLDRLGGTIAIDNAQGCTQLIADKIVLNDVRFGRCAFKWQSEIIPDEINVPEPGAIMLFSLGLLGLGFARPRKLAQI